MSPLRFARNAAELLTLSAQLQGGGVQLELLTGPLQVTLDAANDLAFGLALRRAASRVLAGSQIVAESAKCQEVELTDQ